METILENYINNIQQEREKTKILYIEEMQRRECRKERREEHVRMYEEKMKMQQSLIDFLNTLASTKK